MTILNREDYKTVIPQLEKKLTEQIEELQKQIDELTKRVKDLEDA